MKNIKNLVLFCIVVLCFLSPLTVQAKEKQLLDKKGKPFAILNLDDKYKISKETYFFESEYDSFCINDEDKFTYITINPEYNDFVDTIKAYDIGIMKTFKNTNYLYFKCEEDKNATNDKDEHIMLLIDKKGNNIVLQSDDLNQAKEITHSIIPDNNNYFLSSEKVLQQYQNNAIKSYIFLPLIGILISWILCLAGKILIIKKMGIKEWKAVIPFYSDCLIFQKVWNIKSYFIILVFLFISVFSEFCTVIILNPSITQFVYLFNFISSIITFFMEWIFCDWTAKSFGMRKWYTVALLLFLPPVGYAFIGFSKNKYIGNAYAQYWINTLEENKL